MSMDGPLLLWVNPEKRGAVHLGIGDEHVELSVEQATGVATKLLVMAALQSQEPLAKVERILERVTALFASLDTAAEVLAPAAADDEPDDLAPAACASCGVDLGTWQKVAEHGRVGCKGFDSGDVPCPDCDRKFATLGGVGVHRRRAHPESFTAPPPSEGAFSCEDCDCRFQNRAGLSAHKRMKHASGASRGSFLCADCPERFRTIGGLTSHRTEAHPDPRVTSLVDRILADEPDDEDDWTPEPAPRAAPEPEHRLAEKLQRGHEHATRCSCGWESEWFNYASPAAVALREHVDEVAA